MLLPRDDSGDGSAELVFSGRNLHCRRGSRLVLAGLNLDLHGGELLELRGANGSGKTSLLRLLAGLVPATGGTLAWGDAQPLARRVAFLGHLNGLSAELTVAESLDLARELDVPDDGPPTAWLRGAPPQVATDAALQDWGLADHARQPVRRLSQGQRRRLALARVWMARRPLWLLDEPCAGLDVDGERLFDARLVDHLQAGGSAVVATHRELAVPAARRRLLDLDRLPRRAPAGNPWTEDAPSAC